MTKEGGGTMRVARYPTHFVHSLVRDGHCSLPLLQGKRLQRRVGSVGSVGSITGRQCVGSTTSCRRLVLWHVVVVQEDPVLLAVKGVK